MWGEGERREREKLVGFRNSQVVSLNPHSSSVRVSAAILGLRGCAMSRPPLLYTLQNNISSPESLTKSSRPPRSPPQSHLLHFVTLSSKSPPQLLR